MTEYHILAAIEPHDGCARDVALVAANMAGRMGAAVILLTVLPHRDDTIAIERAKAAMASLARLMGSSVPPKVRIEYGETVSSILSAADEEAAELIIIGTHGRRGLERALLGSVAEGVIRQAVPVVATVRVG